MANLYVASTGSNTAPYGTWAKAATAPLTATAAAAAGDTIYQHAETFTVAADTTYLLADGVRWICTNDKANEPPQTQATTGVIDASGTAGADISIGGNTSGSYIFGLRFKSGNGANAGIITVADSDNCAVTLDSCKLECSGTSSSSRVNLGNASNTRNHFVRLINTSVKFGATAQGMGSTAPFLWESSTLLEAGSSVPTSLFRIIARGGVAGGTFRGCSFSGLNSTIILNPSGLESLTTYYFVQCDLASASLTTTLAITGVEAFVYDSSASDTHYHLAHYAYNGTTTISTAIYADDGATYDTAGNKHSWVVAGNANTLRANPYISPWITRYNEATSAITPELEILRDGSSTAFTDIEVWSEWMLKTAGGSPLATLYSDYGGHLSTGTAQGNGVGLSGWTGESGTAWSGLLECPSVTPAEIGHVSARIVVAGNHTVYVDPQIRGL